MFQIIRKAHANSFKLGFFQFSILDILAKITLAVRCFLWIIGWLAASTDTNEPYSVVASKIFLGIRE